MSIVNRVKRSLQHRLRAIYTEPQPKAEAAAGDVAAVNDTSSLAKPDPRRVGLNDAVRSGWYLNDTAELYRGFKISSEDVVLDVGCGEGLATLFCAKFGPHVVFSDVEEGKVETLKEKANRSKARRVEGMVSDSMPLPLPDEYATKILSMEVLEHTDSPQEIVKELYRVGKPGAQYLITVPDARTENFQKGFADPSYFEKPNHIHIFNKQEFIDLVESAGLVVEEYTTWGFYWHMWMSIFWSVPNELDSDETLSLVSPPYHPALQSWTNTWDEILKVPGADKLIDTFNSTLPKAQAIIARKPV